MCIRDSTHTHTNETRQNKQQQRTNKQTKTNSPLLGTRSDFHNVETASSWKSCASTAKDVFIRVRRDSKMASSWIKERANYWSASDLGLLFKLLWPVDKYLKLYCLGHYIRSCEENTGPFFFSLLFFSLFLFVCLLDSLCGLEWLKQTGKPGGYSTIGWWW